MESSMMMKRSRTFGSGFLKKPYMPSSFGPLHKHRPSVLRVKTKQRPLGLKVKSTLEESIASVVTQPWISHKVDGRILSAVEWVVKAFKTLDPGMQVKVFGSACTCFGIVLTTVATFIIRKINEDPPLVKVGDLIEAKDKDGVLTPGIVVYQGATNLIVKGIYAYFSIENSNLSSVTNLTRFLGYLGYRKVFSFHVEFDWKSDPTKMISILKKYIEGQSTIDKGNSTVTYSRGLKIQVVCFFPVTTISQYDIITSRLVIDMANLVRVERQSSINKSVLFFMLCGAAILKASMSQSDRKLLLP